MAEEKAKIPKRSSPAGGRWGGPELAQKSDETVLLPLLLCPLAPASSQSGETCFPTALPKLAPVSLSYIPPLKDILHQVVSELSSHVIFF